MDGPQAGLSPDPNAANIPWGRGRLHRSVSTLLMSSRASGSTRHSLERVSLVWRCSIPVLAPSLPGYLSFMGGAVLNSLNLMLLQFSGVVVEIAAPSAEPREGQPLSIQNAAGGAAGALKVGDRVMGVTRFGAFADHIVLPAHQLRPLPESWDYSEGAAFLVQVPALPPRPVHHL